MGKLLFILLIFFSLKSESLSPKGEILVSCPSHVSKFLLDIWADASVISKKHNIPLALILAQACQESGFGRSKNARLRCNLFGIRRKGKIVEYGSIFESFKDYGTVLSQNCYGNPKNIHDWLVALDCCKYAGDKNYANRIQEIIERYKLYLLQ